MEASQSVLGTSPVAASSTHPLLLVAAGSVTILSLAGVSYFAGWLPGPATHATDNRPVVAATTATAPVAAPAVSPPISVTQSVSLPQEKPKTTSRSTETTAPGVLICFA